MLQEFSIWQFIVAISFICLLFFIQIWIKKNKNSISKRFQKNKRINIIESSKTGLNENVHILKIDNNEFAVFQSKGATPFVFPLETKKNYSRKLDNKLVNNPFKEQNKISKSKETPQKEEKKMMRAISIARRLNPKVNF